MTRDEAIARARAVVCAGCDDTEHEMLRGLLAAYDEARAVVAARWALAREVEELLGIAAGPAGDDRLREGVEAVRRLRSERDEARAQLAALREAADRLSAQPVTAGLLREWADEIERGGR